MNKNQNCLLNSSDFVIMCRKFLYKKLFQKIDLWIKVNYNVDHKILNEKGENQILDLILNLIYPPTCGICGKFNSNFLCLKCQKQLESQSEFQVIKSQKETNFFEEHLYIFTYQGMIRKMILNYKFQEKSYLYKTIVNFLLKNEKFFSILQSYDTIIPVPISRQRKRKRGYNQSELLAKEMAKKIKIEYNHDCLFKTKNVMEQSKLKKEERQNNIKGAYQLVHPERLETKKILLVDDIYTTGSTVKECSKILRQAQPKKIGVFTIAKD